MKVVGFIRRSARLLWLSMRAPKLPPLEIYDVCSSPRRVMPGDLDELRHMNNGVYLSTLDHARFELIMRTGLWKSLNDEGMYPVVSAQTISYRKSLELWQKYAIESRLAGVDERSVYVEQRFVVGGEVFSHVGERHPEYAAVEEIHHLPVRGPGQPALGRVRRRQAAEDQVGGLDPDRPPCHPTRRPGRN